MYETIRNCWRSILSVRHTPTTRRRGVEGISHVITPTLCSLARNTVSEFIAPVIDNTVLYTPRINSIRSGTFRPGQSSGLGGGRCTCTSLLALFADMLTSTARKSIHQGMSKHPDRSSAQKTGSVRERHFHAGDPQRNGPFHRADSTEI